MKAPLYLTTFLALAVLAGCKKESAPLDTFVEGRILTYGTDQKVSNKQFKINLYSAMGGSGLSGGETLIQENQTDTNGYFSFEFTAEEEVNQYYYRIMEGAPKHHTPSYTTSKKNIEKGIRQEINYYLYPHAWLNLHIKNVNPQPGDVFSVNWGGGQSKSYHGEVDEKDIFFGQGNAHIEVFYSLKRNNQYFNFRDTVWMSAFDTTYHLLEY